MGFYLNSTSAYIMYRDEVRKPYFVDKTGILEKILPLAEEGGNYVCITRPRRFGKSVVANMVAAYFSKGCDAADVFDPFYISGVEDYQKHLNQYNVVHISFNEIPRNCKTYEQYITRIESKLIQDLVRAYPEVETDADDAVWDVMKAINMMDSTIRFIFVLDEWDYIFHRDFVMEEDKKRYIDFLSNLLKGKAYVQFAYMTGILPIAKYSSGSELNMFLEYTMIGEEKFSEYFGFTDKEVDSLYAKYKSLTEGEQRVSREGLRAWYDGYHTKTGLRVYNPRSVVASLSNNNLGSYWTSSGPYDEIFYYIEKNVADVREDLAFMVSGIPVSAKMNEYAAVSMNLNTKNEIFSAMVVYGFLSYENGYVSIPNKELMDKFSDMLLKEKNLGYVYRLAKESEKMIKATLACDTKEMLRILEFVHNTEVPLLNYNNEAELTAVVNLIYLAARDSYRIEREDKAGIGYVDFIFYPERDCRADCIILELKVDHTAEEAIRQIKEKQYALRFAPKAGEVRRYTGRILLVGIAYDKETKEHSCRIEIL